MSTFVETRVETRGGGGVDICCTFVVEESAKDDVRYQRDLYARWISEELEALKALGIDVTGFDYLTK